MDGVPRLPTFMGEVADKTEPKGTEVPAARKAGTGGDMRKSLSSSCVLGAVYLCHFVPCSFLFPRSSSLNPPFDLRGSRRAYGAYTWLKGALGTIPNFPRSVLMVWALLSILVWLCIFVRVLVICEFMLRYAQWSSIHYSSLLYRS